MSAGLDNILGSARGVLGNNYRLAQILLGFQAHDHATYEQAVSYTDDVREIIRLCASADMFHRVRAGMTDEPYVARATTDYGHAQYRAGESNSSVIVHYVELGLYETYYNITRQNIKQSDAPLYFIEFSADIGRVIAVFSSQKCRQYMLRRAIEWYGMKNCIDHPEAITNILCYTNIYPDYGEFIDYIHECGRAEALAEGYIIDECDFAAPVIAKHPLTTCICGEVVLNFVLVAEHIAMLEEFRNVDMSVAMRRLVEMIDATQCNKPTRACEIDDTMLWYVDGPCKYMSAAAFSNDIPAAATPVCADVCELIVILVSVRRGLVPRVYMEGSLAYMSRWEAAHSPGVYESDQLVVSSIREGSYRGYFSRYHITAYLDKSVEVARHAVATLANALDMFPRVVATVVAEYSMYGDATVGVTGDDVIITRGERDNLRDWAIVTFSKHRAYAYLAAVRLCVESCARSIMFMPDRDVLRPCGCVPSASPEEPGIVCDVCLGAQSNDAIRDWLAQWSTVTPDVDIYADE